MTSLSIYEYMHIYYCISRLNTFFTFISLFLWVLSETKALQICHFHCKLMHNPKNLFVCFFVKGQTNIYDSAFYCHTACYDWLKVTGLFLYTHTHTHSCKEERNSISIVPVLKVNRLFKLWGGSLTDAGRLQQIHIYKSWSRDQHRCSGGSHAQ